MITEAEKQEAERLVEAQRRLEEKRRTTSVEIAPDRETVEQQCARLQEKFAAAPIVPEARLDVMAKQALALREAADIPRRHRREIPDGVTPWHEQRVKLVRMLGNGFIVALTGIQGTGKTQLGSALIYAAAQKLIPCRYATAMDFFMAIKRSYDDAAKLTEADIIAKFVKPKLLVVDECDERSQSDWENRLLFHMINQRYNNLVDTVLISRKAESEFLSSFGDSSLSIQSRIQETGGSIVCDWGSFREGKE